MKRVCTAILRGDAIVMVQMRVNGSVFWTLPGGGVEAGEKPEEAAGREALEETGLRVQVGRLLFIEQIESGECGCFLATPDPHKQASLG
jgi:8-oxo-dGTP diphosphatase